MNISTYYILINEDLVPQYVHSSKDVIKIGITPNENRRERPILLMEGKGHGYMGITLSVQRVVEESDYMNLFKKYHITWILDFILNNPTYTEENLIKEIVNHRINLVTEEH